MIPGPQSNKQMTSSLEKFRSKSCHVVVMGIGYVGLPLVAEFAKAGFLVTGLDRDARKVESLALGESYISDVPTSDLRPYVEAGKLTATTDSSVLSQADAVIVCVPTPLNKTKEPDMQFILAASDEIVRFQHPGMLVVLESTTYPGTTSEVLVPKLTSGAFNLGENVFVAFSPERVDPGNQTFKTRNTPKVIGGQSEGCLEHAMALYEHIIDTLVPVSSTETAETVKLLENTFRAVNIGLVNEVAMMARKLGIDPFEVIRAAATKPFGFMPFYPGPGLGGHCIPIDPLYLSWKLKSLQYEAQFIGLADKINSGMPAYVVQRLADCLNDRKLPVNGSRILVYGVAYKPDIEDVRESPALGVIHELRKRGAIVAYMDPNIASVDEEGLSLTSVGLESSFADYEAVILVTNHSSLPAERMLREANLILDTRDGLREHGQGQPHVHGL